jgi:hemolysin activation/secretion protein
LRFISFLDAGWLRSNNTTGSAKPDSDRLASVGLGLRYTGATLGATAEWGRIVKGSVLATPGNSAIPQSGDQRLHVSLTTRF